MRLLLSALVSTAFFASIQGCMDPFQEISGGCYYLNSSWWLDWWQGRKLCANLGGFMAAPLVPEDHKAVLDVIRSNTDVTRNVWLGASNGGRGSRFVWAHSMSTVLYTNWSPGQPVFVEKPYSQSCILVDMSDPEMRWGDDNCFADGHVVCQYKPEVDGQCVPQKTEETVRRKRHIRSKYFSPPAALPQPLACPPRFVKLSTGCYFFSNRLKADSWDMAKDFCQNINAALTEIRTPEEHDAVRQHATEAEDDHEYFLGATDEDIEGKWMWDSSGNEVDLDYWYEYRLGNTVENCLAISPDMDYLWNDVSCTGYTSFVCTQNL